jgi:hypothetical protein
MGTFILRLYTGRFQLNDQMAAGPILALVDYDFFGRASAVHFVVFRDDRRLGPNNLMFDAGACDNSHRIFVQGIFRNRLFFSTGRRNS